MHDRARLHAVPALSTDPFWITEEAEPAGAVRLRLGGELDIATAGRLRTRLQELSSPGQSVVVDLAWLEFIDSSGVRELVRAVTRARRDGWTLTFDGAVGPQVLRIIDLLGLRELLWPRA